MAEELDPTSPEVYAKIKGVANMELRHQDTLDSFFQDRILSVWKALRDLGWKGTERSYDSTKNGYVSKFNFNKVGAGDNIVGYWVSVMDGSDIQGEVGDNLTKTPEQLAADIDGYVPEEQEESVDVNPAVELSGKELGDFPDTPEGKKQLRSAAKQKLDNMIGEWVTCPALSGDVEIRKSGVKKVISHSGDARKLKVVSAIDQVIGKAKKLSTRKPHDGDVDKSAKLYHILRTEIALEEVPLAVRVVIKEDIHGQFHYDITIHDNGAVFDSAKDKGHDESQPLSVTTTNGGGTDPAHIARHQLDNSIEDNFGSINSLVLDSVGGKMVINLFIEGEEPEVVEEDLEVEESEPSPEVGPENNPDSEVEQDSPATIADVNGVMQTLKRFIGKSQLAAVGMGIRGEEGQFFKDKMIEIANTIQNMPKTYEQDGKGDEDIVYLHYFKDSADWYITEKDMEGEQHQAFGLADLFGDGGELGYISIQELIDLGVELDFHWEPKTIVEIKVKNQDGQLDQGEDKVAEEIPEEANDDGGSQEM